MAVAIRLFESAQEREYLMILVFAGAGASKALDPQGYPTTEEFFKKLPKEIRSNQLFAGLEQFLRQQLNADVIDIEQWLWASAEARQALEALESTKHPTGWMFA